MSPAQTDEARLRYIAENPSMLGYLHDLREITLRPGVDPLEAIRGTIDLQMDLYPEGEPE